MKKMLALACSLGLAASLITGCGSKTEDVAATTAASAATEAAKTETPAAGSGTRIALITMDSIDQHWVTLNEGAQKAAGELGVTVQFMAPNTKDDAQQIECVNNAVSAGAKAIIVAANGPDAISSALKEAQSSGVKICLLYTSPSPRDTERSRMPSSA